MKKIVFLAPYPTAENIKEGMMQRVAAVDTMFPNGEWEKSYVVVSFKSMRNTQQEVAPGVIEHRLSIWTGRKKILQLLNAAQVVYAHSLYGVSICGLLYWGAVGCKNTLWDVHGIVPEELRFAGSSKLKVKLFERLERLVASRVSKITTVTHAMSEHLQQKYPNCKAQFYTYAILPITIDASKPADSAPEQVVLLYAGNTQKYQNVELMAQSIAQLVDQPNVYFDILTGSPDAMRAILDQYGLCDRPNVAVSSVAPTELDAHYRKAHYGYVLRDDIDVNRVACPTKIVEYLAYGLRPVVIQPRIGDFAQMGYEYIEVQELATTELKGEKSEKNIEIYNNLIAQSNPVRYKAFIEQP